MLPTCAAVMLALLAGLPAPTPSPAEERQRGDDRKPASPDAVPPRPQRTLYRVQNGDAAALAEVVGRLFKGEADVLAAPPGSGNAILISGPPATVAEAAKLIDELDGPPRSVEVEVTLAELPRKDGADLTPDELAKVADLTKAGGGQRIRLTAVEGQPVTSTTGGSRPVVTGTAVGGFGPPDGGRGGLGGPGVRRAISYQSVGTMVQLTARVGSNGAVVLDLGVQDSKVRPPDAADEAGAGAAAVDSLSLTTKLTVPAGKPVVARLVRTDGRVGATVAVVVVTAKVVEASSPPRRK